MSVNWVNQTIAELKEVLSKDYDESNFRKLLSMDKLHMQSSSSSLEFNISRMA